MYELLKTEKNIELYKNALRSYDDCINFFREKDFNKSLREILICVDILSQIIHRSKELASLAFGDLIDTVKMITNEKEAEYNNSDRYVKFLHVEIPEWKDSQIKIHDGRIIHLDVAEILYQIRCKQVHENSDLSSDGFAIKVLWNYLNFDDPFLFIVGKPEDQIFTKIEINGMKFLQRVLEVAQKWIGLLGATKECFSVRSDPFFVYNILRQ